jgi:predicted AAA+ superfamily ATPase
MLAIYTRFADPPSRSFFLFGPRGTGKTTWLRQRLPDATWFDLLRTDVALGLSRHPAGFRQVVDVLPNGAWVVIDEVQRMPALLNEVHAILTERPRGVRFAMSGSSARKLRRLDVNLLAGRAINRQFFPLTAAELAGAFNLERALQYGTLPQVQNDPAYAIDTLDAYVANYVREEILQEALVRQFDSFARFLEAAATANGQVVNVSGIARDAAVARPTVQGYFSTLVDTLVGIWLPAWRRRAKVKEVASPKFYLFDPGVARALAGRVREPLEQGERGFLLETLVLHELRAALAYRNVGGHLHYWRTPSGSEVDFVYTRGNRAIGIEVKAASRWKPDFGAALRTLVAERHLTAAHAVYTGAIELKDGPIRIWPVRTFFLRLAAGEILAS